jgi:hypothetical protein
MPSRGVRDAGRRWLLVVALLAGAAVAVLLGVYASRHQPTGLPTFHLGFPTEIGFKAWITTLAMVVALFQLWSSLRLRDRLSWPRDVPLWLTDAHRLSGTIAVVLSLPVAYHCLWSLGFRFADDPWANPRVLVHALAGCFFYGWFVTKMLAVRVQAIPRSLVPWAGGFVFGTLTLVWLTSAAYYFAGRV